MTSSQGSEPQDSGVYLQSLEVSDVLRIRSARLRFEPTGLTVVSGDNGQGKTSLMRAIRMALGGDDEVPNCPVRIGAEQGDVIAIVGKADGKVMFKIHRKLRAGGSYLEVEDARGDKVRRPRQTLTDLLGLIAIDPVAFADPPGCTTPDQRRKARLEILLRVSRIDGDLTEMRAAIATAEEDRLAAGRAMREEEKSGLALDPTGNPIIPETPDRGTPPTDAELAAARQALTEAIRDQSYRQEAEGRIRQYEAEVADLEKRLAEARQRLEAAQRGLAAAKSVVSVKAAQDALDALLARVPSQAEANAAASARAKAERYLRARDARAAADAAVHAARERLGTALRTAKYPTPAIRVTEDGDIVVVGPNGQAVPFEQESQARRIVVGFVVMAAIQPHLRLVLIEDGNDLDQKTLAGLAKLARDRGYQLVLERVARDVPGSIIIEDGEVAS